MATKRELCLAVAAANPEATRQELIELFKEHVPGISDGGASTYASAVKKELEEKAPVIAAREARLAETDDEIDARLKERFDMIDLLSNASCLGNIRSLIVSGPAGLGKSHAIENAVRRYDPSETKSIIAKGFVRPTGLYLLLHEYRRKGNVIVLDDADSIFADQDALNILKAALDTTKKRTISWRSETRMMDADGNPVDRVFDFEGTVIFITNKDFDAEIAKGSKMSEHYEALISRSHYVECDMHTVREYVVRIRQVVKAGMLRSQKGLNAHEENIILEFIEENKERLRELTLRVALKLADIYKVNPGKFEALAKVSLFKGGVRH